MRDALTAAGSIYRPNLRLAVRVGPPAGHVLAGASLPTSESLGPPPPQTLPPRQVRVKADPRKAKEEEVGGSGGLAAELRPLVSELLLEAQATSGPQPTIIYTWQVRRAHSVCPTCYLLFTTCC